MTRKRLRFLAPLLAGGLVASVAACQSDDGDGGGSDGEFPRNETVYTGGAEWGTYSDWNPNSSGESTYVRGFLYETLFAFDPWEAELTPWLAESGDWTGDDVFEVTLREGIEWSDGEPLTADDVVFTFDLRDAPGVEFTELDEWLDSVEAVDDRTVRFTFSDPRRGQWDNVLYNRQIVPEHTWGELNREDLAASAGDEIAMGSGPFTHHSHTEERAVWERNDNWWGIEHLGMEMPMRYVIDFKNESNEVALNQIVQNELDLSNFFLPGVNQLPQYGDTIHTFYDEPPHMLSANTAALIPNTQQGPTSDPELRRALAYSIDVGTIVDTVYQDIVAPADPTGLHPLWVDQGMADSGVVAEHGFSYDPAQAEQILDGAGYVDADEDGWRDTPDGEPFELSFLVQRGWTDWEQSAEVIAEGAQAAGLNVVIELVDPPELDDLRDSGEYDLVIDNQSGVDNHPYTHYVYLFQQPVEDEQPTRDNPQRYENDEAWDLTRELARLSVGDEGFDELLAQLQEIALEDMVIIPMWYNGLWSQVNNTTWTNWPSDAADTPNHYASSWGGILQMGGVQMFAELEPVE